MSHDFKIIYKKSGKEFKTSKHCPIRHYGGTVPVEFDDVSEGFKSGNFRPTVMTYFNFNMTYNYTPLLKKIGFKDGINTIYGMNMNEILELFKKSIDVLKTNYMDIFYKDIRGADPTKKKNIAGLGEVYNIPSKAPAKSKIKLQHDIMDDYWACTPSNVCKQLEHILNCLYWIKSNHSKIFNNLTFTGD